MPADIPYISKFLSTPGVEGQQQLRGYVPSRPGNFTGAVNQDPSLYTAIGASGVTIVTGCDLGPGQTHLNFECLQEEIYV